ncbi:hypothetical protein D9615_002784 [Tricholomella constricta]|uniref:Transcription factor CBF/NF-Y/archaeal histone domain-containing protein n=1 Tax=Tricholomella constricta TaxID=117010 RepID=A0A8H5M6L1_9AGAR|nr:hypothetical protein D9615_002784 [Tricholomella constricta]
MSHHANGSAQPSYPPKDPPTFMSAPETVESDVEDEVDQLDSDSDSPEMDADTQNGAAGGGQRIPGSSLLPSLRLENIIQADGVTGNLALSKEGLFILSVATEEFIKRMAQAGQLRASAERRSTVNYSDMAATTQQYQEFMFLNGTIPAPVSLSEALLMREAKEKEVFDEDPTASSSIRPFTSASAPPKTKVKARNTTNGQASGSISARHDRRPDSRAPSSSLPSDDRERDETYSDWVDTHAPRTGAAHSIIIQNGRLSLPARPSPLANGHTTAPSRSGTLTPAVSHEPSENASPHHYQPSRSSPLVAQEETHQPWPGQYTGPASGFLQGPGGPFGRVAQNPGRTIYSQQHRAD